MNKKNVHSLNWIDIDKDGQPNPIVQINDDSLGFIIVYDSVQGLSSDTLIIPGLIAHPLQFEDVNNDNSLEIIGLLDVGDRLSMNVFQLDGNTLNSIYNKSVNKVTSFHIADWNNDGYKDILLNSPRLQLIENSKSGFSTDIIEIETFENQKSLLFADISNNGYPDIIVNAIHGPGSHIFFNEKGAIIKDSVISVDTVHNISFGDINLDGKLDLFIASSNSIRIIYEDSSKLKSINFDSIAANIKGRIDFSFMADFNSDGYLDLIIKTNNADSVVNSYLIESDSLLNFYIDTLQLSSSGIYNAFFDNDEDGDLDILELSKDSSINIIHQYENKEEDKNYGPSRPSYHTDITTSNGTILVWSNSFDDHSPEQNHTYDIQLSSEERGTEIIAPNYSVDYPLYRILAQRGNLLFANEIGVSGDIGKTLYYGIQAIDNSLSVIPTDGSGNGGSGSSDCPPGIACGKFQICSPDSIQYKSMFACEGESLILENDTLRTAWYSSNQGFLGISNGIIYNTNELDTVYYNSIDKADCSDNNAIIITPLGDELFANETIEFCQPTYISLNTYTILDSALWVKLNGFEKDTLHSELFNVISSDTLIAYQYANSCLIADSLTIKYDTTSVTITNGDLIEITEGEELQLQATNADNYYWSPNANINDVESPQPMVSPLENTVYYVEGYKNGTCQTIDSIRINVKKEAFIPELFTPNNDGTNDKLLIYGLNQVEGFHFQIYNRKGNLVFETTDAEFMRSSGWNGESSSGPAQSGIYYWRVSGSFTDSNQELKLNNSKEGKVHLTR
ncbi:FG-GAP-like repeat-containing protein [Marivirga atlantica]|uniref:Gliding motility-associated C-terminal domain-containing protein n=1 Tax=Marivirga atlantica TaxID=1548457 RepID=A0A937DHK9_9BACT|nr:FG-GAP-like repeat-containing protein [Marivirga atlantica]MBL0764105.1 gliding motility-associated C-terminal domain-containing protein [Marivirga atlantica]